MELDEDQVLATARETVTELLEKMSVRAQVTGRRDALGTIRQLDGLDQVHIPQLLHCDRQNPS